VDEENYRVENSETFSEIRGDGRAEKGNENLE
jgi:hypothetical protein